MDTLIYQNNIATYKDNEDIVKACSVKFTFTPSTIKLKESANYNQETCWGFGLIAFGVYKKISAKIPVFIDPWMNNNASKTDIGPLIAEMGPKSSSIQN